MRRRKTGVKRKSTARSSTVTIKISRSGPRRKPATRRRRR